MDEESFRALYEALRDPIFAFASRRLTVDQAKDVVGETFEVVWRKRSQAPADSDQWPAWCVGIARNKVLQEWQRRTRKHHDNRFIEDYASRSGHAAPGHLDVADVVAESITGRWVWSQLSDAERDLASIAFLRDISVTDGAGLLGISTTAYTTRLNRLRRRIVSLRESADVAEGDTTGAGSAG